MNNDLISRQAAIDLAEEVETKRLKGEIDLTYAPMVKGLTQLPSAQPEPCEDAVSRQRLLTDLKELIAAWKKYPVMAEQIKGVETAIGYVELIPSVKPDSKELSSTHKAPEPCEDAVSRQAVSSWLKQYGQDVLHGKYKFSLMYIWKKIMDLPSVTPEHKTGRWLYNHNEDGWKEWWTCDQCGKTFSYAGNFCQNCGAKMKEGTDEPDKQAN